MRAVALLLILALVPAAQAGYSHDHDHEVVYDPAAEAGLIPDPSEVQAAVDAVADHPWATVHTMGKSLDGIPIRVVEITDPDSTVPMEERVVTFIMTQQHGNEPAGTPAALRLLDDLSAGAAWTDHLENQVLLLMPQANPDGALDDRRQNEAGEDINRDHVDVGTPEAKAIHAVLRQWDVHMAFDHHEYGGTGIGYPSPVQIYDFDVTTMYPNHGNVRAPTADMSIALNYDHVKPRLEEAGYTHGDYGWTTVTVEGVHSQKVEQLAGGPDPGILRNNFGLNNVVGLLVESYVAPGENPLHSYERRVGSHEVVMHAVLEFGHENAAAIIDAKRESERLNLEEPMAQYVEGETVGPLPAFFTHDAQDADGNDLLAPFREHSLPVPEAGSDGHVTAVAQERGGLIAALLHPQSSRAITEGRGVDDATLSESYLAHPDFRPTTPEPLDEAADDQQIPALGLVSLLGLVALALLRRR